MAACRDNLIKYSFSVFHVTAWPIIWANSPLHFHCHAFSDGHPAGVLRPYPRLTPTGCIFGVQRRHSVALPDSWSFWDLQGIRTWSRDITRCSLYEHNPPQKRLLLPSWGKVMLCLGLLLWSLLKPVQKQLVGVADSDKKRRKSLVFFFNFENEPDVLFWFSDRPSVPHNLVYAELFRCAPACGKNRSSASPELWPSGDAPHTAGVSTHSDQNWNQSAPPPHLSRDATR